ALLNNGMILGVRWNGNLAVEWASCVELASCQFQYIFGRAGCPLYSYSARRFSNAHPFGK
ncbi:hypothetical protein, partial [Moorena sp. SIO2C4]|uniref:hypothetical protein n=1 Tax=Moorena sp. SIO2C4 TaxID=2607824 RepID=UPI00257D9916